MGQISATMIFIVGVYGLGFRLGLGGLGFRSVRRSLTEKMAGTGFGTILVFIFLLHYRFLGLMAPAHKVYFGGGCFYHCCPYVVAFGLHGLLLAGSGELSMS